jgi:hypothetical protein
VAGWLTLDEAHDWWREAPDDDELLQLYLDAAATQVVEYGPKRIADLIVADPDAVPNNYRLAQLAQTKNVWNAVKMDPSGAIGDEGFQFRPFPMDSSVKNLIRPAHAKPVVA